MGRVKDYPRVTSITDDKCLLVDGINGTKSMKITDLVNTISDKVGAGIVDKIDINGLKEGTFVSDGDLFLKQDMHGSKEKITGQDLSDSVYEIADFESAQSMPNQPVDFNDLVNDMIIPLQHGSRLMGTLDKYYAELDYFALNMADQTFRKSYDITEAEEERFTKDSSVRFLAHSDKNGFDGFDGSGDADEQFRTISPRVLTKNLIKMLNQDDLDSILSYIYGTEIEAGAIPLEEKRNIWRGKNLGREITDEQYNEIANGTFNGLYLGDYWEIIIPGLSSAVKYRIMDFDYWYKQGLGSETHKHHVTIVSDPTIVLGSVRMNSTRTTATGYPGSDLYKVALKDIQTKLESYFGSHLFTYRETFPTAIQNGVITSYSGYLTRKVDLLNEIMIFGSYINALPGTRSFCTTQLAGMRLSRRMNISEGNPCWLRDVASDTQYCSVSDGGHAKPYEAEVVNPRIKVAFGIC